MKHLIFIGICLALFSSTAKAETGYVNDIIKITLRSGPSIDHKVTMMLKSGQTVEVLDKGEDWTFVRLPSEKKGWVLSRFISMDKPSILLLEELESKHNQILEKINALSEENSMLKKENKRFISEFTESKKKLGETTKSYNTLKKDSANFLTLRSKYEIASKKLSELTKKTEELEKGLINNYIMAGLCGVGVLLLGFIIGFSAKREKKRSSLYI